MARHGITPVVAVVLLLMMTVGAAGGAYTWFSQIQEEGQREASAALAREVAVRDVRCQDAIATLTLSNTGDRALDDGDVRAELYAGGDLVTARGVNVTGTGFLTPGGVDTVHVPFSTVMDDGRQHRIDLVFPRSGHTVSASCTARTTLVAYYPFDEGSGTWANDSAGTADGRLYNGSTICSGSGCPSWTGGVRDTGVRFGGDQEFDYVDLGEKGADTFRLTDGLTVMAWISPDGSGEGGNDRIVTKDCSDWWCLNYNTPGVRSYVTSSSHSLSGGSVSSGEWAHVAVTYDPGSGDYRLYENGSVVASTDTGGGFSTGSNRQVLVGLNVESSPNTDSSEFGGVVDEVKIHDAPLSGSEISRVYEATAP